MIALVIPFPTLSPTAPLANHLWQSTLFAIVVTLLTLMLKNNRAQVRYALWLAASLKFLIPIALLVTIGSQVGSHKVRTAQPVFASAMQQINEPFVAVESSPKTAPAAVSGKILGTVLQKIFPAVWFGGFALALLLWWRRWQHIAAAMRGATPVKSGRELDAVRRLERSVGRKRPTSVIVSECNLEPGIVGIFRPALLLPASVAGRLDDAQLDAIILHELWHVRRRDNLAGAVHMLVQAVFWFHPLVWWIGARLIDERERACDEKVVAQGSEPQAYAEGILKVCEFYVESPLSCVAGVTGSNLKKRIEEIMRHRIANRLNFAKKALLFTVAVAAVAVPVVIGVMNPVTSEAQSQPLQLEVAAILKNQVCTKDAVFVPKQSKFMLLITLNGCIYIRNMPVNRLIYLAYGRPDLQISGTPEWANTQGYDLSLKLADPPPKTPVKEAVQKLLEEQFKLVFHREIKDAAVYDLVVADGGLKLTGEHSQGVNPRNQLNFNPPGHLTATDVDMAGLLPFLNRITQRVVVDKTGLKGAYDFTLDWTSDANHPDSDALIAALKNQLGLDLKPGTAPKEMLIVDHVERVGGGN